MTPAELRDFFAGLAMQAFIDADMAECFTDDDREKWFVMCAALGRPDSPNPNRGEWVAMYQDYTAHRAYQQADAMMREREKP